jgi:hypothetical protein
LGGLLVRRNGMDHVAIVDGHAGLCAFSDDGSTEVR